MKVTPVSGIQQVQVAQNNDARDRAIAALMGNQAAVNQDQVSVEELGALKGQNDTSIEGDKKVTGEATAPLSEEVQPKDEPPLSTQYAQLAKREKALRAKAAEQEKTLKAREEALAAKESELVTKSSIDTSKYVSIDDLKSNAFAILQKHGVSYDELSEQAIAAQSPEAQAYARLREEMQGELKRLREEQDNTKKTIEDQQTKAYQQALKQLEVEAKSLVSKDPSFETIKEAGATSDVVELIERTFNEEGRLMSVEEACEVVENFLVEEALKYAKVKKIQERLKPVVAPTAKPQQQPQTTLKTLTNSVGSQKPLSPRERAILAFRGDLK